MPVDDRTTSVPDVLAYGSIFVQTIPLIEYEQIRLVILQFAF
jgi:hypothetical protein